MKFIHTADLHLGASPEGKLGTEGARERRQELLDTFGHIAALADKTGAAVLIAGDLFDKAAPSRRTVQAVLSIINAYPRTTFLCLPGNHDGGSFPAEIIPENLILFGAEWTKVTVADVDVYGIAAEGVIPYDALQIDPDRKNVVMLHGAVKEGGAPDPGTVVLSRLAGRGIDYLALGHYHSHRIEALDGRGVYAYSGTPEGRGMDEAGECGVLLIDTDVSPICPEFHKTARRTIHRTEIDVGGLDTPAAIRKINEEVKEVPPRDIVRVELTGKFGPEAPRPDIAQIESYFTPRFYYFEAKDKTRLDIRPEDYASALSLKGELVRLVMASDLSEAEREAVLRAGFAALRGEEDEI